jgi:hypothetical protein
MWGYNVCENISCVVRGGLIEPRTLIAGKQRFIHRPQNGPDFAARFLTAQLSRPSLNDPLLTTLRLQHAFRHQRPFHPRQVFGNRGP